MRNFLENFQWIFCVGDVSIRYQHRKTYHEHRKSGKFKDHIEPVVELGPYINRFGYIEKDENGKDIKKYHISVTLLEINQKIFIIFSL